MFFFPILLNKISQTWLGEYQASLINLRDDDARGLSPWSKLTIFAPPPDAKNK